MGLKVWVVGGDHLADDKITFVMMLSVGEIAHSCWCVPL